MMTTMMMMKGSKQKMGWYWLSGRRTDIHCYPSLCNSNTLLDVLKRILRVYVQEVSVDGPVVVLSIILPI